MELTLEQAKEALMEIGFTDRRSDDMIDFILRKGGFITVNTLFFAVLSELHYEMQNMKSDINDLDQKIDRMD